MTNTNYIRLIYGDKVYINISSLPAEITSSPRFLVLPTLSLYGQEWIYEESYSRLLFSYSDLLEKNGGFEERTVFKSIRSEILSHQRFFNLSLAIFPSLDVEDQMEKELKRIREDVLKTPENFLDSYYETLNAINDRNMINMECLKNAGLDIQYITTIKRDSGPVLNTYIVGEGIFKDILIDDGSEDWSNVRRDEKGNVLYFEYDGEGEYVLHKIAPHPSGYDFRRHSIFENIVWCLQNAKMNDEWSDCFSVSDAGISLSIPLTLAGQLMNKNVVFSERHIEGIVNFKFAAD